MKTKKQTNIIFTGHPVYARELALLNIDILVDMFSYKQVEMEEVPQPEPVEESAKPKGDDPDDDDVDEEDLVSFILFCLFVVVDTLHVKILTEGMEENVYVDHETYYVFTIILDAS